MWKSWLKKLASVIVKFGPGLVGAIMDARAKKGSEKPGPEPRA